MKSNLAYIGAAADAAVAEEVQNPRVPASALALAEKQGIRMVASFPVADPAARQKVLDDSLIARRKKLTAYAKDRETAAEKLSGLGVVPLAFLPTAAWNAICRQAGLFSLRPDEKGDVRVDARAPAGIFGFVASLATWIFSIACVAGMYMAAAFLIASALGEYYTSRGLQYLLAACAMVVLLVASAIAAGIIGAVTRDGFDNTIMAPFAAFWRLVISVLCAAYNVLPRAVVLEHFFPGHVEPMFGSTRARLLLPQPPADVTAVLDKAKALPLYVATVGQAVSFSEDPGKILGRRITNDDRARKEDRALMRALRADPIIYLEQGSAVAIIAQFGDFPIEQEIIDRVINSEHLI